MKKTLIALVAMAGIACGATYTPLKDTQTTTTTDESVAEGAWGWIDGGKYNYNMTINHDEGSITNAADDWYADAATYRFQNILTLGSGERLDFTFDVNRKVANSVQTITFVGTTQAVVIGHADYDQNTNLDVGISNNVADALTGAGAHGYILLRGGNQGFIDIINAEATLAGGMPEGTSTISGSVSWDGDSYALTLSSSAVNGVDSSLTYDLGSTFDIRDLVFTFDGKGTPTVVSNLKMEIVPEPATATLSLLALAGLAARRRRK